MGEELGPWEAHSNPWEGMKRGGKRRREVKEGRRTVRGEEERRVEESQGNRNR
jgi:hypothetical protein